MKLVIEVVAETHGLDDGHGREKLGVRVIRLNGKVKITIKVNDLSFTWSIYIYTPLTTRC